MEANGTPPKTEASIRHLPPAESVVSIVTSQPVMSRGEDAIAKRVANHDEVRERTDNPFVLEALDAFEEWLSQAGFEVRHRKGSHIRSIATADG